MYYQDYFLFLIAIVVCGILAAAASSKVNRAFAKYDGVPNRVGVTGYDTVRRLMQRGGVQGIAIGRVSGKLSDHYHPTKAIVNLSDATYGSRSIAAVAVAAHEVGHVMQKQEGYLFYNIRTTLVPIVNFGNKISMPLVLVGLLLDMFARTANADLGFTVAMVGVLLYGGSFLFALVTLPVELNASRRAKDMLLAEGILSESELHGAGEVLRAAALTYLASLLTSLVYFLRFLVQVLTMFGRRDRRR